MNFCPRCGHRLPDPVTAFCVHCGSPLHATQTTASSPPPEDLPPPPPLPLPPDPHEPADTSARGPGQLAALIVGVLALLAGLVTLLITAVVKPDDVTLGWPELIVAVSIITGIILLASPTPSTSAAGTGLCLFGAAGCAQMVNLTPWGTNFDAWWLFAAIALAGLLALTCFSALAVTDKAPRHPTPTFSRVGCAVAAASVAITGAAFVTHMSAIGLPQAQHQKMLYSAAITAAVMLVALTVAAVAGQPWTCVAITGAVGVHQLVIAVTGVAPYFLPWTAAITVSAIAGVALTLRAAQTTRHAPSIERQSPQTAVNTP